MSIDEGSGPDRETLEIGAEVPEADAIEQRQPAVPEGADEEPEAIPADAAEADALDQTRGVPPDEDADRSH